MRQTFKNNYSVNKSSEIILEEKEKRRSHEKQACRGLQIQRSTFISEYVDIVLYPLYLN